jgi:aspartate-semialdehyde dehydrogenase
MSFLPERRFQVGILGSTGLVGQRLVARLADHPWFETAVLGASERSVGRRYADAVRWALPGSPPSGVRERPVVDCRPSAFEACDLVLSSLDGGVARDVEGAFADAGYAVVSNSSAFRMDRGVPLVIPEVNADHLDLVEDAARRGRGYVVTNPNCSVIGLALALAPLHEAFGIRRVVVTTLQALSGAGVAGPAALALTDNVLPFIRNEEDKMQEEFGKILGRMDADSRTVRALDAPVSAHCHRVATIDGHLEAVSIECERPAPPDEAVHALRSFRGLIADLGLPTAPVAPIVVRDEEDRPQPRLDRDEGAGMSVVVGRVRPCPALTLRLELLSHNTVRGAAGAALLNAELLAARGWLRDPRSR